MFKMQPQNVLNSNSVILDINNIIQKRQNNILNNTFNLENNNLLNNTNILKSNYNINNYFGVLSNSQNFEDNNDTDYNNIKTLDEFKQLLRKIDERLDAPLIENRPTNI